VAASGLCREDGVPARWEHVQIHEGQVPRRFDELMVRPQDQARAMRRRDHEKHLRGPFTAVGDQIQPVGIM
jgi:hypothetical protein